MPPQQQMYSQPAPQGPYGGGRGQQGAPVVQQRNRGRGQNGQPQQQQQQQQPQQHTDPSAFADMQHLSNQAQGVQRANPQSRTTSTTLSQITSERFADLRVHDLTRRAMAEVLRYETMTQVQAKTIPVSLSGSDILAKAKTGTGKTLAFLLPSLEHALQVPAGQRRGFVTILIISPTRELAQQIADEGKQVMTFMDSMSLMCVYGGTNISTDTRKIRQRVPDVLVGTPGRLNDLFGNHGLRENMARLRCMVFDEADQLLDMGFRPAITEMLKLLPPKTTRQTLLFSATMPNDVMHIAKFALRDGFQHVDCVGKEKDTHQHVDQSVIVHPLKNQFAELAKCIMDGINDDPQGYKILAFFTTARMTQMAAEVFNGMGIHVLEMHSRKSQSARNKCSEQFRDRSRLIMFSSDVSARGMDYPDVSRVIQIGLPADTAQYTHRLGRTARAGKTGDGLLLLSDFEASFIQGLKQKGDVQQVPAMGPEEAAQIQPRIDAALRKLPEVTVSSAYQAWLGYYNSNLRKVGWSKPQLVQRANEWIVDMCLAPDVPMLQAKTVGKMGLRDTPGLRVERGANSKRR
eukprot:TRINITY_DN4987_c3_g1_i1.p2 TRINITY_DN4987_c3_g1~~TRINITY_DN4987_c3_g1_i1.p2  ORF type:complete len:627 (+),score=279.07 TRINITY_DN4987_c3_g1_i1:161-1882(+)